MSKVIVQIEIVVVCPDRMIELNGCQGQLALEERDEMEPALEVVAEGGKHFSISRRWFKDREPRDVHRRFRRLAIQKAGIES
jgi:hypothetical protein